MSGWTPPSDGSVPGLPRGYGFGPGMMPPPPAGLYPTMPVPPVPPKAPAWWSTPPTPPVPPSVCLVAE